jgi:hypothetical protein
MQTVKYINSIQPRSSIEATNGKKWPQLNRRAVFCRQMRETRITVCNSTDEMLIHTWRSAVPKLHLIRTSNQKQNHTELNLKIK